MSGRKQKKKRVDHYEKLLELWLQLPTEEKERTILRLLRDTDVGQRILRHGFVPFIPHHMWERSKGQ